ncbi:MAG: hypothetical protein OXG56_01465 [Gammaproteobacteria bacterium]|nr:hypothetical protein [Gammaproteobacteria bacterium]
MGSSTQDDDRAQGVREPLIVSSAGLVPEPQTVSPVPGWNGAGNAFHGLQVRLQERNDPMGG